MPRPKKTESEKKGQTRNHDQISMTVDPRVLEEINRFADLAGMSRSAFLVMCARREIERMKKLGIGADG
jgi:hypothetical protein